MKLDMQSAGRDLVVTTREHTFDNGLLRVVVPKHFRTDLGTLPILMYLLVSPYGRPQRGFLVHDVLYKSQACSRPLADAVLREAHLENGVGWWTRFLSYWGVRLFGWSAWWKNKNRRDAFRRWMQANGGLVE